MGIGRAFCPLQVDPGNCWNSNFELITWTNQFALGSDMLPFFFENIARQHSRDAGQIFVLDNLVSNLMS